MRVLIIMNLKKANPGREPTWEDKYYVKKAENKKFVGLSSKDTVEYKKLILF